jgi:hypothetical protein
LLLLIDKAPLVGLVSIVPGTPWYSSTFGIP